MTALVARLTRKRLSSSRPGGKPAARVGRLIAASLLVCLTGLPWLAKTARAEDWPAVDPAELASKTPRIEPNADAEAFLWDVRVAHEIEGGWARTEFSNYLRMKVFTEAGRERLGTVDIPYVTRLSVSDIAARTIRPDGTIVELDNSSVYDRTLVKAGGIKVNAKSFALPGLEVGSIVEYRWKEMLEDQITNYFTLQFQRDIPVRLVRYHIKPIVDRAFPYDMRSWSVGLKTAPFTREKDGFFMVSATDIPAFSEEPDMPAAASVRPWMLIYYTPDASHSPAKYWQDEGKKIYEGYRGRIRVTEGMKQAAAQAVEGATDPEGKLRKLFEFVIRNFRNTGYHDATQQNGEAVKENKNTEDTWAQKAGTGYDITLLFIALSDALGYDARLVRGATRDTGPFDPSFTDTYFLRASSAAVRVGDSWRFCDPASPLLPYGMLRSNEQGQWALISDPKQPESVVMPLAAPEASLAHRDGRFRLDGDGTLEGQVRVSYTGESAFDRKWRYLGKSKAEREEAVREGVKSRFGAAEVSDVKVEGVSGPEDLEIAYHVKIPGYAQRTERRLFLQYSYFSRGYAPRYSATERRYPIVYPNAWSQKDTVSYELPAGYALEKPEGPGVLKIGDVGQYVARLGLSSDRHLLAYERDFDFGRGGRLMFPAKAYPVLKRVFDQIQEQDNRVIVLREEGN